jgi:hypothetical protein
MSTISDQIMRTFARRSVGIEEFATSDEFCGKTLYPRQIALLKLIFLEEMTGYEEDVLSEWLGQTTHGEVILSPQARERRDWLRDRGYSHFPEIVMVGGRRSSKGFVTALAVGKKMYETWKLGDPGKHYGIDADKEIYFSCVAASLDQAKQFQYADLVSVVTRCKALDVGKVQEESFTIPTAADQQYLLEMKNRGIKVGRDFAKLRGKPLAANADTLRGSATMVAVFDEMAFMMEGESRSSAAQCYAALKPSLDQFGKAAMVFLNSSPYNMIGKFYEEWENSHKPSDEGNPDSFPKFPNILSIQFPSWELYKDYEREKKIIALGTGAIMVSPDRYGDPDLNSNDEAIALALKLEEEANPETFKVERRGQWASIEDAYLNEQKILDAFSGVWEGGKIKSNMAGGTYQFVYKGHCDPSSTTAGFGFAMAHLEYDSEDRPHVIFDYVKRWNPKDKATFKSGTIEWERVINEIVVWLDAFRPEEFSFDQFNSAAPMQTLRSKMNEKRLNTQIKQVTATAKLNWNRWETFKAALNLGLVHIPSDLMCPDAPYAMQELKFLRNKNGKVDKLDQGPVQTKDIADCICECTFYLLNKAGFNNNMPAVSPEVGAQGGYQMGMNPLDAIRSFYSGRNNGGPSSPTIGMAHRERGRRGRY